MTTPKDKAKRSPAIGSPARVWPESQNREQGQAQGAKPLKRAAVAKAAREAGAGAQLSLIDAWEFCRLSKSVNSTSQRNAFPRLLEALHSNPDIKDRSAEDANSTVDWTVEGFADRNGHCRLRMMGRFIAPLTCLRCGYAVNESIDFDRTLRLCKSEQEADSLETDEDEDAVAAPGKVSLLQWLEDELLLSLPMFPAHADEDCGETDLNDDGVSSPIKKWSDADTPVHNETQDAALRQEPGPTGKNTEVHRPFETLARLMKKPGDNA